MALRPLHDRLLVKRLEEKEQVVGSIIIPDTAKEKPQQAKVLAVGPGRVTDDGKIQPIDAKVGDTVVFGKYSGTEVKIDGDELLIIREDDVLGVDTLPDGESVKITFEDREKHVHWDLKVVDGKGNSIEWHDLNLIEISEVTLHYKDGKAWADIK